MIRPDPAPARTRARVRTRARWLTLLTLLSMITLGGVETRAASASLPSWSTTASPNATANTTNEIEGVSCPTVTTCVAVGYFINGIGIRRTLAATSQGGTWSLAPPANLGAGANSLAGVACSSVTSCVAVGSALNGTQLVTLIEQWDGTSWSITPSPNRGTSGNELTGVACASASSCVAVGYYTDTIGVQRTLVETWQGTSWSLVTPPSPGATNALLNGVACTSATSCVAVGYSVAFDGRTQTLVETLQGTSWSIVPSPTPNSTPSSGAVLTGVSCANPTSCVGVGWSGASLRRTLIETWRGTSWSVVTSPNPAAARSSYLRSVSCTTTSRCIAVGLSSNGATTRTVVSGWNGAVWSLLPSPNPGTLDSSLNGVSCASSTTCVAAGSRLSSDAARTFVLSGSAPADGTAPVVSLSTPIDGGYYVVGQSATASYACVDEIGGSGTSSCVGTTDLGAAIDTSSAGVHPFSVTGTDGAGNTSTASASYTVVQPAAASSTLPAGGGSVTTDAGAGPTPSAPLATTVTGHDAGTVSIQQGAVTLARPSGFRLLGVQADVVAPIASPAAPLTIDFDVDVAMLPPGATKDNISVIRDAALLADCLGATTVPAGATACVSNRADAPSGGGDARVTVVSTAGGQWNLAAGAAVQPSLSIGSSSVVEGNAGTTPMSFAVLLSAPSVFPVSVHFASSDVTAKAGSDYAATSGTLTFAPGQVVATVTAEVNGDTTIEPTESLSVTLSSPSGATISQAVGTGTIVDDDATAPGAARRLVADPGNGSAVLSWSAPATSGGRPIGGYVVTPFVGGSPGTPRVFTTPARSQTITGLTNGTTYSFAVAAINAVGTGPQSARSAAIAVGAPATPLVSAVGSSTRAALTWSAPLDNGYAVTSYTVTVYRNGVLQTDKTHVVTCTQPCVPGRSWTVTGLANGTNYTFRVAATNSEGAGRDGATGILVSATPAPPGKPGPPYAQASTGAVAVSWTAPPSGTATIDEYVITVYKNGVMSATTSLPGSHTSHAFLTVVAGATYRYTVRAHNVVGSGPVSGFSNPAIPS